jgi:glycosyltransferase involved in cell wall biosynthesis
MKNSASRRVGHILPYEAIGGTEHATLRLAQVTREAGYENTFFVLETAEESADFFRQAGFEVIRYPKMEIGLRNPQIFWRKSKRLAKTFADLNLDLIHCADYPIAAGISLAGFLSGRPVISHVRNRHEAIQKRDRVLLKLIKHWVFVSEDTRRKFVFEVSGEKSTILYDGIEINEKSDSVRRENRESVRREYDIEPNEKIIGTLARVAPQKDFFTLGSAVKKLIEKGLPVKVLIVGSTSREEIHRQHFAEVTRFLTDISVERNFIFTDFQTDTIRFLDAFDVFVLSTNYEGFPLVNLEAMAQKIPVVATAVDGIPEAIVDGETGFLYEHKDAEQLAAALERLLNDSVYAQKIGNAGFRHVEKNFSRRKYSDDVLRLYRRILKLNDNDSAV